MNAPVACLLFAAAIDWLESLLPVLFVGFWILSQVFAIFRRVAGGGEAAKGNGGARPQPPAAPEAGPELRGDLQKQIEEFLRQATGERPVQPKPQPRPIAQPKPAAPRPVVAKAVTPPALSSRETAPRARVRPERPTWPATCRMPSRMISSTTGRGSVWRMRRCGLADPRWPASPQPRRPRRNEPRSSRCRPPRNCSRHSATRPRSGRRSCSARCWSGPWTAGDGRPCHAAAATLGTAR